MILILVRVQFLRVNCFADSIYVNWWNELLLDNSNSNQAQSHQINRVSGKNMLHMFRSDFAHVNPHLWRCFFPFHCGKLETITPTTIISVHIDSMSLCVCVGLCVVIKWRTCFVRQLLHRNKSHGFLLGRLHIHRNNLLRKCSSSFRRFSNSLCLSFDLIDFSRWTRTGSAIKHLCAKRFSQNVSVCVCDHY